MPNMRKEAITNLPPGSRARGADARTERRTHARTRRAPKEKGHRLHGLTSRLLGAAAGSTIHNRQVRRAHRAPQPGWPPRGEGKEGRRSRGVGGVSRRRRRRRTSGPTAGGVDRARARQVREQPQPPPSPIACARLSVYIYCHTSGCCDHSGVTHAHFCSWRSSVSYCGRRD